MPGFQPSEEELTRLGFKTNSPAQPYPTRSYFRAMTSGNFLTLTPRPGVAIACEFNERGHLIAKHRIDSIWDIQESLVGNGRRQVVK
ncbi:hypothetical protein [Hymenobacter fodinae]|uniref:Uncharacterized protein n=1 Tax=Hymenobacter fodinae TaxID=2510796 RepID=A0A4Z0P3J2_9BACT|nr:hypothetical protein [Hymenobacter fodinae]TGE05580.1 hypothetical protein EU556_19970 [Hymenobacter fodinae]